MKSEAMVSDIIAGCVDTVYTELGEGLLERIYYECLVYELEKNGLKIHREKEMIVKYKRLNINTSYVMDLLVNNMIVILIKKSSQPEEIFRNKLRTLIKLSKYKSVIVLDFDNPELFRQVPGKDKGITGLSVINLSNLNHYL